MERLAEHLKGTGIHVGGGSQSANFVRSSKDSDVRHGMQLVLRLFAGQLRACITLKIHSDIK